jgi:ribosomal protein L16 Arg81 hydroxylase
MQMATIPTADQEVSGPTKFTGFDDAIFPVSRENFLESYWNKCYLRVPGHAGKFKSVLAWEEINRILEEHRLQPPRLRLFQDGKAVEPTRYLSIRGGSSVARIKSADLMNCLAAGATLIIDQIDELAPGVRQLATDFEDYLRIYTIANLYAGWRRQKGFDLHWDAQDTMIIQIDGRKHWKVHRPTRVHPLKQDVEKAEEPEDEPIWEGVLEAGDVLYLPRGWWHIAFPLDEPSLHITMTIVPANGTQFMRWFVDRLRRHTEVRMNVPHLASQEEQRAYLSRLRSLLIESWNEDLLIQFLAEMDAKAPARPRMRLPEGAMQKESFIRPDSRVRLAAGRRISVAPISGQQTASFRANDTQWQCAVEIVPALEALSPNSPRSVRELCSLLPTSLAASKLRIFLTALAMGGVLAVE